MSALSYDQNLSSILSAALDDIGVTEKIILKRRRSWMLMESLDTITRRITGQNITTYNLGSQSEGSTTMDLDSDIDSLFSYHDLNIIQNWVEARSDAQNVVMVQDETTAPGHCFLQFQVPEVRFPAIMRNLDKRHFIKDKTGRWLLKNTCFDDDDNVKASYSERNGPAYTIRGGAAHSNEDNVIAWYCRYWPNEAQQWLRNEVLGSWPSGDLKRECEATGCMIVPVSSKGSEYVELEWRISTCLAERCLMFSLNVTQMKCYVLLKLIRETFLKTKFPDVDISSYVCKTTLFHCIQNTHSYVWKDTNLLGCLEECLLRLETFINAQYCEHFFIPGNNLLKGKVPNTHVQELVTYIHTIIENKWQFLFNISLDKLKPRLLQKILNINNLQDIPSRHDVFSDISGKNLTHIAKQLDICYKLHLKFIQSAPIQTAHDCLKNFEKVIKRNSSLQSCAYELISPFFSSSLASAITSAKLDTAKCIPYNASVMFRYGFSSDLTSGKLKYACALYSIMNMNETKNLLEMIDHEYDRWTVKTVCSCHDDERVNEPIPYSRKANTGNEELIKQIMSFCVKFLPSEMNCVPHELKYELFRSTAEDERYRGYRDFWMNWAVVDSLPFLYFLQYKTYGSLQMKEKQKKALSNLEITAQTDLKLYHKETALNLLGQCMEQENRFSDALYMYICSLKKRRRNNAARIHICKLLSALYSKKMSR